MPQDLNIAGIIYLLQLLNCPPVLSTFSEEFTARGVFFFSFLVLFFYFMIAAVQVKLVIILVEVRGFLL